MSFREKLSENLEGQKLKLIRKIALLLPMEIRLFLLKKWELQLVMMGMKSE